MKKILMTVVITIIVGIAGATYFLYYVGDRIIEESLKIDFDSLDAQIDEELNLSELDNIEEADELDVNKAKDTKENLSPQINEKSTLTKNETSRKVNTKSELEKDNNLIKNSKEETTTGKNANLNSPNLNQKEALPKVPPKSIEKAKPEIDLKKIKEIKDSISPADKVILAKNVVGKFSKEETDELSEILAGGISKEEKVKIKEMFYSNFSEQEIQNLKDLYKKYDKK